jgi:tRNA A58 N-methylase Trm61
MINKLNLTCFFINKRFYSTTFKTNEIVIAYLRNSYYDKNTSGSTRVFQLTNDGVFTNKYFSILHEHIIGRRTDNCVFKLDPENSGDKYKITILIKRMSLYEYIAKRSHVAVPSQFAILSLAPFLLEIDKGKKVLESGTGNGSMTLTLSKYLDMNLSGQLDTFDIKTPEKAINYFDSWKVNYNSYSENKWFDNVKFYCGDISKYCFSEDLNEYYDNIYLDLMDPHLAIGNVYKLLKRNGIIVVNVMHLTQILKCLKYIEQEKLNLVQEVVIEPSIRLWEIERYGRYLEKNDHDDDDINFNFKCRVEDHLDSKAKRDGIFSPHWPGFLVKFRKV